MNYELCNNEHKVIQFLHLVAKQSSISFLGIFFPHFLIINVQCNPFDVQCFTDWFQIAFPFLSFFFFFCFCFVFVLFCFLCINLKLAVKAE